MTTKNLARTVIEGGRYHRNCWDRRQSHGEHRVREHEVSTRLVKGADYDALVYPARRVVHRSFADKLRPAERWLAKRVGRSWSKTRSELFTRFDTRTTAGRHVLFDHLLTDVAGERNAWRPDYYVDDRGILRKVKRR
jgi:hypothetical protein